MCDVSRAAYQLRKNLQRGKQTKMLLAAADELDTIAGTACLQLLVIEKDDQAWRGRYERAKRDILAVGTNTQHNVAQKGENSTVVL